MPFLNRLGYDVFNPFEVVPEFISDIGTKKGEKVDYAIQSLDDIYIHAEALQQTLANYMKSGAKNE